MVMTFWYSALFLQICHKYALVELNCVWLFRGIIFWGPINILNFLHCLSFQIYFNIRSKYSTVVDWSGTHSYQGKGKEYMYRRHGPYNSLHSVISSLYWKLYTINIKGLNISCVERWFTVSCQLLSPPLYTSVPIFD